MAATRGAGRKAPPAQAESIVKESVVRPVIHIPLKQWGKHPDLQRKLRAILEDPIFHLAHNTILHAVAPGTEPSAKAESGVSAEATNNQLAHRYSHRSGMGHTFRLLRYLASDGSGNVPSNPYGELQQEDE